MKPEYLELLDKALRKAWDEVAVAYDMNGEDTHESFNNFLQGDYFQLVQESSDAGAAFEAETAVTTQPPSFRPM